MDTAHVDRFVVGLTRSRSRRGALLGLAGGVVGLLSLADTDAKHHKKKHKKKHKVSPPASPPASPPPPPASGRTVQTLSFSNATTLTVPNSGGPANTYPATIIVSGFTNGVITDVNVVLNGATHGDSDGMSEFDIMLSASHLPGRTAVIMSDIRNGISAPVTLVLDDAAAGPIPNGPTLLQSGTYLPTNIDNDDSFPAPAPAALGTSALSVFNGQNPNGTWQLWVLDDSNNIYGGRLDGGWSLVITAEVDA